MEFEEFRQLFISALESAVKNAEGELGRSISGNYEVILHGAGYSGDIVDVNTAAANLYVGKNEFYRVIDVAVQQVSPNVSRIFVRVSGHKPVPFYETWNTPEGSGPFKQIMAQIQEVDA